MAANQLAPTPVFKAFDNNGAPLYNGQLFTYAAGTTTPQTTYVDSTTSFPNTNPVVLNSRGEANVWLNPAQFYKFVLKDSTGAQIWSVDNIAGSSSPFSMPTASGTANVVVITNPLPISLSIGVPQWFVPVAANITAATINVDSTGPKAVVYLTKALVGGELEIGVPALIIYDGTQWNLINSAKGPVTDYYVDSSVSVNTITVAVVSQAQAANTTGARIRVKIANTNTSSPVIIWGGSGPFSILLVDRTTTPPPGALPVNYIADLIFDAALGAAILQNPVTATGSFTLTYATGVVGTITIGYAILPDGNTIQVSAATSTIAASTGTGFSASGVPSILVSATEWRVLFPCEDNSAYAGGARLGATNTTTWVFYNGLTAASWTNALNKGIILGSFATYPKR